MLLTMAELCDEAEKQRDKLAYAILKLADAIESQDKDSSTLSADQRNARVALALVEAVNEIAGVNLSTWQSRANALRSLILEHP